MNLLAPLARPIFEWNHDVIMRQGGEGLARLLDVRLVRVEGTHQSQEALVRGLMFGLKVFPFLVGALLVLRPVLVSKLLTFLKARDY
jgi:hypothetical protein